MLITTDLNSSLSSTSDNLDILVNILDKCDHIQDHFLPEVMKLANKLINTQQQMHYQVNTISNNCLPMGIAKQCKFTFSGNTPHLQHQLQQLFYEAGSRSLDLIIQNTKTNTDSYKRKFYSMLEELKSACDETGLDYNKLHCKIQSCMRTAKQTITSTHNRKLSRDQQHHKHYIPLKQSTPTTSVPKIHKPNRRFKRPPPKNKPARRTKHRSKRQKLKSTGLPKTINIDKFHYNLTNIELTEHHKIIFSLGQKFCPTPKGANWSEFETCIENWSYLLRYAVYYHDKPNITNNLNYENFWSNVSTADQSTPVEDQL